MKSVQTRVVTPKPAEDVYAYLADFNNQPEWRFDVLSSELTSGETGVVGARYKQRVVQNKKETDSLVELTEAEQPSAVAFRTFDDGPITVTGSWHIKPNGGNTEVLCDVAMTTRGFVRLFEPMMGPQLRKIATRYEQALSERLNAPEKG